MIRVLDELKQSEVKFINKGAIIIQLTTVTNPLRWSLWKNLSILVCQWRKYVRERLEVNRLSYRDWESRWRACKDRFWYLSWDSS